MKLIRSFKNTYGNTYGILVLLADVYFALLGAFWFFELFLSTKEFNYVSFLMMICFTAQIFFKRKLANLILGILSLFLSIWFSLSVLSQFPGPKHPSDFPLHILKIMITVAVIGIVMAGILILSYLKAFKQSEKDNL